MALRTGGRFRPLAPSILKWRVSAPSGVNFWSTHALFIYPRRSWQSSRMTWKCRLVKKHYISAFSFLLFIQQFGHCVTLKWALSVLNFFHFKGHCRTWNLFKKPGTVLQTMPRAGQWVRWGCCNKEASDSSSQQQTAEFFYVIEISRSSKFGAALDEF